MRHVIVAKWSEATRTGYSFGWNLHGKTSFGGFFCEDNPVGHSSASLTNYSSWFENDLLALHKLRQVVCEFRVSRFTLMRSKGCWHDISFKLISAIGTTEFAQDLLAQGWCGKLGSTPLHFQQIRGDFHLHVQRFQQLCALACQFSANVKM